jgi:outer membrane receptor for Fe3+-dicitrate
LCKKQKVDAQSGIVEVFDQKYFLDKRKAAPSGRRTGTKESEKESE